MLREDRFQLPDFFAQPLALGEGRKQYDLDERNCQHRTY